MKTSEPSQQTFWQETELQLMSSRADFRAKTLALPESKPELEAKHEAGFTRKSSASLANYDLKSQSWRTCQRCLVAQLNNLGNGLEEYSETWPKSGMMRNGTAYALEPLDSHKGATVYGCWPTPTASDGKRLSLKLHSLTKRVRSVNGNKWNFTEHAAETLDGFPHPALGEWIMGFPPNWTLTEPKPSETQSFRK